MNASLNSATAEPALSSSRRGLHLTPGTVDYCEHADHGTPIRVLRCDFPKDFGTEEEREFLIAIMGRMFDGKREFSQCGSDLVGFEVYHRIWSLLECANDHAERQRVIDILNLHREPGEPELRLEVEVEGVIIFPGRRRRGYTAEQTSIYVAAGDMRSRDHLRRERPKTYSEDTRFRTTIYK